MKRSKNGFSGKQLELFGRKFSKFPKTIFSAKTLYNGSQLVLLLENSQKAWILGLTAKLHGCFWEKNSSFFQIALNGKVFVVWFSNILTVKMLKISQEFQTFFLSWKTEGSFEKSLIFKKNWYIFQICSRRRSKNCFCLRILKTKNFRI